MTQASAMLLSVLCAVCPVIRNAEGSKSKIHSTDAIHMNSPSPAPTLSRCTWIVDTPQTIDWLGMR